MATLDKVIEMQKQGITDAQINSQLQNEGISPKEINDSLNQAKVKSAVSPPEGTPNPTQGPAMDFPQQAPPQAMPPAPGVGLPQGPPPGAPSDMQQSIMPQEGQPPQENYPPEAQGGPGPEMYPPEQGYEQPPADDYYQPMPDAYGGQDYPGQEYYGGGQGYADTETISEIAEQIVSEKINEFKKQTGDIQTFKTAIQDKVDGIDERLKRIEDSIEKLQHAIIGKVGEFGESSAMIHQDLENLHGTVSKMMNPLMDNYNELKKLNKRPK